jgi:acetyl/propionyl-CoA carboxylase alpha subunit
MKFTYAYRGAQHTVELLPSGGAAYTAIVDGQTVAAPADALVAKYGSRIWVHLGGRTYKLQRVAGRSAGQATGGTERTLRAPMPGQVRQVLVAQGDVVLAGQSLIILEAMKMEIRIQAPQAAKVAHIAVSAGQTVDKEQTLVELDGEDA